MREKFHYKNLHQYLEQVLDDDSSNEQIIQLKKDYWRAYNTHLKRQKRKKDKHINLSFDKQQWKSLELTKGDLPMHLYLKEIILNQIDLQSDATPIFYQKNDLVLIEQQLFQSIELLQFLVSSRKISSAEDIEKLKKLLTDLNNQLESKF
jgi:hypothetical protein